VEEIIGEWRKLHNEELHDCTPDQILLGLSHQGGSDGQGMSLVEKRCILDFGGET
jgi:hypothetical protein